MPQPLAARETARSPIAVRPAELGVRELSARPSDCARRHADDMDRDIQIRDSRRMIASCWASFAEIRPVRLHDPKASSRGGHAVKMTAGADRW